MINPLFTIRLTCRQAADASLGQPVSSAASTPDQC